MELGTGKTGKTGKDFERSLQRLFKKQVFLLGPSLFCL